MLCRKIRGRIIRVIVGTFMHSSFGVLNFMLPTCKPNFAEVACAT